VDVDDSRWMSPVSIQGAHMILDDLSDTFEVDKQNS
ncbi:MAG: iron siderophore-binding protein, partial [Rhodococcus qingshengii]